MVNRMTIRRRSLLLPPELDQAIADVARESTPEGESPRPWNEAARELLRRGLLDRARQAIERQRELRSVPEPAAPPAAAFLGSAFFGDADRPGSASAFYSSAPSAPAPIDEPKPGSAAPCAGSAQTRFARAAAPSVPDQALIDEPGE